MSCNCCIGATFFLSYEIRSASARPCGFVDPDAPALAWQNKRTITTFCPGGGTQTQRWLYSVDSSFPGPDGCESTTTDEGLTTVLGPGCEPSFVAEYSGDSVGGSDIADFAASLVPSAVPVGGDRYLASGGLYDFGLIRGVDVIEALTEATARRHVPGEDLREDDRASITEVSLSFHRRGSRVSGRLHYEVVVYDETNAEVSRTPGWVGLAASETGSDEVALIAEDDNRWARWEHIRLEVPWRG